MLPRQIRPVLPPQEPSVLIDFVAEEPSEEEGDMVQLPNLLWHPAPQYAASRPHQPLGEQQSPQRLPRQMKVVPGPQLPSVLTDRGIEEEEEEEEEEEGVGKVVLVLVRKVSWYSLKGCESERLTSPGSWQG